MRPDTPLSSDSEEFAAWFKGKRFANADHVSDKADSWLRILEPLRDRSVNVLEIGSRDGRSALFFLNYLRGCRITCLDQFRGDLEACFDHNLSDFAPRARKLRGKSFTSLNALRQEECQFDVIFVASNRDRESVLLDSALSWPLLRQEGIFIWDCYRKNQWARPRWKRPTSAIDGILLAHRGEYEQLLRGYQMIVRKTVAAPTLPGAILAKAKPWRSVIRRFRSVLRRLPRQVAPATSGDRPDDKSRHPPDYDTKDAAAPRVDAVVDDFKDNSAFVLPLLRALSGRAIDALLARGEAETRSFCEKLIEQYRTEGRATAAVLTRLAGKIDASTLPAKEVLAQQLLDSVCSEHLKQRHLRKFANYRMGESFIANVVNSAAQARALRRERQRLTPEWFVNVKRNGHLIAAALGARVPRTYCTGIASSSIEIRDSTVVKPVAGANAVGVYLVQDQNTIFDGESGDVFAGETELRRRIAAQLASGKVKIDSWRIEELIRGRQSFTPVDVKFYCFYGRVAMVYEVQRLPERRFNWYDINGNLIRSGRYENLEFEGEGFRSEDVALAARISAEIPTPFLRIDFMRAENGDLVFCEFSPHPGNFEEYHAHIDLMLGRQFTRAEARLRDDLLMGKSFARFLDIYTKRHPKIEADRRPDDEALPSPVEDTPNDSVDAELEDFRDNLAFASSLLLPLSECAMDALLARGEVETREFCYRTIEHYRVRGRSGAAVLTQLARKIDVSQLPNKRELAQRLLESICSSHIRQNHLQKLGHYRKGESFTANMVRNAVVARALQRERKKPAPEWFVNSKRTGHLVAAAMGARVPRTYCAGIASANIELKDDIVIKPAIGADAVGVFLVQDGNTIFDATAKDLFGGEAELRARIAEQLASNKVKLDSWRIEELIRGDACLAPIDVKFYCFYGRVAMAYEVKRLPQQKRFNWYDRNGNKIRTGRYENLEFESDGLGRAEVALAEKISAEIPTPFLRVDFLRAGNGDLVFCEFTPSPENFEEHTTGIDSMMGTEFTSAEARLTDDLLMGKSFSCFRDIYNSRHGAITASVMPRFRGTEVSD
jgi:hypothetical protein